MKRGCLNCCSAKVGDEPTVNLMKPTEKISFVEEKEAAYYDVREEEGPGQWSDGSPGDRRDSHDDVIRRRNYEASEEPRYRV